MSEGRHRLDVEQGLQELGFSAYEAKVYLALLRHPGATGYEVARHSGVPRSKVYEVLEKLAALDVVHTSQTEDQVRYHPLPYRTLLQRRKNETTALIEHLSAALEEWARPEPDGPLITVRGYEAVLTRSAEMLASARQDVFLSAWPKEIARLSPQLVELEARGVDVWLLVYGTMQPPVRRCYFHEPPSAVGRLTEMLPALVVVVDHSEALLASLSATTPVTALWTRHRGVALIAAEYIKHDLFLAAVAERLGPELPKIMAQVQDLQRMWFG